MSYRTLIRDARRDIGYCLTGLRDAKRYPDNVSPTRRANLKMRLRGAQRFLAQARLIHTEMFNPRTKQMRMKI